MARLSELSHGGGALTESDVTGDGVALSARLEKGLISRSATNMSNIPLMPSGVAQVTPTKVNEAPQQGTILPSSSEFATRLACVM